MTERNGKEKRPTALILLVAWIVGILLWWLLRTGLRVLGGATQGGVLALVLNVSPSVLMPAVVAFVVALTLPRQRVREWGLLAAAVFPVPVFWGIQTRIGLPDYVPTYVPVATFVLTLIGATIGALIGRACWGVGETQRPSWRPSDR
ncbi:hypothetical protein [Actinomyces ruminicola]|uniref:Uncharacterized protein n=1 Tax=Actinomyces ruminicola TaxID=332524 RepID=A0A1G9YMQ0_9ACTO|nr:hypothetical protein [Actinomyces ruminicola]SDN10499.1 hypothetical protein SAMN04487766_11373 [Actinomyces ruminicola]